MSVLLAVALLAAGCGGLMADPDGGVDADGGGDGGDTTKATWTKPEGFAAVTFFVDDTANRTYASGDLRWMGTFIYDPETNIITRDPNWGRELGTYPVLYDDGPIAEGGHEMPGATAGDHIFSTAVYVKADPNSDLQFQYGAINETDNWIWVGPNGLFSLPAASTGRVDAAGFFIHPFGTYDLKLVLDTKALHPDLWPFDPQTGQIHIEGSMNSWRRIRLLDDGDQVNGGDEVAGDGLYTYLHSAHLGDHDGLLYGEQRVQFVFFLDETAYRTGDTLPVGVSAWVDCGGNFESESIFLEPDSLGSVQNPTVSICAGPGDLGVGPVVPPHGPASGGALLAIYGSGFAPGAQVRIGNRSAGDVQVVSPGQLTCRTPALPAGSVQVRVSNPDGSFGVLDDGFSAEMAPLLELRHVWPAKGPTAGGQEIVLSGTGFEEGASVSFGGTPAESVQRTGPEQLRCLSPQHAAGTVTISVANPDGRSHALVEGYRFSDAPDFTVDWAALLEPTALLIDESDEPPWIQARVYEASLTAAVGCSMTLSAELGVGPEGSDPALEPDSWNWIPASCRNDCQGCTQADVFLAQLPSLSVGIHRFCFRFSLDAGQTWLYADGRDGSLDGFQIERAGRLEVLPADAPLRIEALEPAGASIGGGIEVSVHGAGFGAGCEVILGGELVPAEVVGDSLIRFVAPAHPAGPVDLTVACLEPQPLEVGLPGAFSYWLAHTPQIDGLIGDDWPAAFRVADNGQASDWGENHLAGMYVAFDDDHLYLALEGWVDASVGNALVAYLDRDFGPASGVSDMNSLVDRQGAVGDGGLDDAVSSVCRAGAKGFGAEYAAGTLGMASVEATETDPLILDLAGLRSLADPVSLVGQPATVLATGGGAEPAAVEMAIPWSTLFPAGRPAWPTRLAIAVRLLSRDGLYLSNATLPAGDPLNPQLLEPVFVFDLP